MYFIAQIPFPLYSLVQGLHIYKYSTDIFCCMMSGCSTSHHISAIIHKVVPVVDYRCKAPPLDTTNAPIFVQHGGVSGTIILSGRTIMR